MASLLIALLPMAALGQLPAGQTGLINWCKDGNITPFLYSEVDSITYSKVDLNGLAHPNAVVQVVWTPDSVYRIPIVEIDSISFKAPDPVYNNSVFHIRDFHFPYVTHVTDLTVTFNASIPADSLPYVGQVVVSDRAYEEPFEEGFAGRVTNIVTTGNTVLVECEEVSVEDIYDDLLAFGRTVVTNQTPAEAPMSRTPRRIEYENEGVIYYDLGELTLDLYSENDSNYMRLAAEPSISIDYTIRINKKLGNVFKVVAHNTLKGSFEVGHEFAKKEITWKAYPKAGSIMFPTSVPLLFLRLSFGGFFTMEGTGSISALLPFELVNNIGYDSQNGGWVYNFDGTHFETPSFDVNLNASVSGGLAVEFATCFISEKLVGTKLELLMGPEAELEIDYNTKVDETLSWYNLKDSYISYSLLTATVTGGINFFGRDLKLEYKLPYNLTKYYLFPEFTAPSVVSMDNHGRPTALTTDITRDLIFGVKPGLAIYKNGIRVHKYYSAKEYKSGNMKFQMTLPELGPGTYTAKPIFCMHNSEKIIEATPSSTITIPAVPTIGVSKESIDFGDVPIGTTKSMRFKVTGSYLTGPVYLTMPYNDTHATLTIKPETISPESASRGQLVTVTCTDAISPGSIGGIINISSEGVEPKSVQVTGNIVHYLNVNPTSWDFGMVAKGKKSDDKTFSVSTSIPSSLTINKKGDIDMFYISKTSVSNGGTFIVRYQPTAIGSHKMTIIISDGTISKEITVTGTCPQPSICVQPTNLDFGTITVGTSTKLTFHVDGSYISDQYITLTLKLSNENADVIIIPTNHLLGAIGGDVTVTVKGLKAGSFGGSIDIIASGVATKTVTFSGHVKSVITVTNASGNNISSLNFTSAGEQQKIYVRCNGANNGLTLSIEKDGDTDYTRYFKVRPASISKVSAGSNNEVIVTCTVNAPFGARAKIRISGGGADDKIVYLSYNHPVTISSLQPNEESNPTKIQVVDKIGLE